MRFRSVILWNALSQFGQSGIMLLSTIILARMLTPDDFGIVGIVTIFIAFSQMMVDSEMGGALLRKKEVDRVDYSTLFYYNLGVSILLYAILYFSAPLIADIYKRPPLIEIIRVISITIIIHAFRVVQRIMIFRDLKFKVYAYINVGSGLVSLIVAMIMAYYSWGYWSLVWQQVSLAICNVIFMEVYNRFIPVLVFSKASFKYQFSFGISLLGSDAIKTIANNISTNIIAKVSPLQFTGYFTQTSRLTNFCQTTFGALLDQSIFPMLAKYDDIHLVRSTYYRILKLIFLGLVPVTILFIILAPLIIEIALGKEWLGASYMFRILSLGILPVCIQILCRNIMKALGSTHLIFYLETAKSIIVISLMLITALLGTTAIIWSLIIAQLAGAILWIVFIEKELRNH